MSNNQGDTLNLTTLEQSILHEYQRLYYGQQNKPLSFPPTNYAPIPPELPLHLTASFHNAIHLTRCSCFEVITFAIMEHVFSCPPQERKQLVDTVRSSICDQNFLFGSSTIKGLLIKGLKDMSSHAYDMTKPIANHLKDSESLTAFSEFWKEVIEEQSQGEIQTFSDEPRIQYFQQISNYLGVTFQVSQQVQGGYSTTVVNQSNSQAQTPHCYIVVKEAKEKVRDISYVILLRRNRNSSNEKLWETLPEPNLIPMSEEFTLLKAKAWEVKQKGLELARQFRQFYNLIKDI